jgi:hypothetical protein
VGRVDRIGPGLDRLAAGWRLGAKPRAIHDSAKVVMDLATAMGWWGLPDRYRVATRRAGLFGLVALGTQRSRAPLMRWLTHISVALTPIKLLGGGPCPGVGVSR